MSDKVDSSLKKVWWRAFLAAVCTLIVFLPIIQGDFLRWDDRALFVENIKYQGFSSESLHWMGTTFLLGHWQPLSWLSYSLDYSLWGMNAGGWHVTNLLLHTVNTVLLYFICLSFLRCFRGRGQNDSLFALLASLFYALHPLRVEVVAWLATRGYLLCTTFCLLTILFYLSESSRDRYPLKALFCFALAALSKGIGMMLPPVLLLVDWAVFKRIVSVRTSVRCVAEKIPFFVISAFAGVMAFLAKRIDGGMASVEDYGVMLRIGQAVEGVWFYLWKVIAPFDLSPLYYQKPQPGSVAVGFILTAVAATVLFLYRRRLRMLIFTLAAFLILVFPMLGITQSGQQTAADRFLCLAALPFSILMVGGLSLLEKSWARLVYPMVAVVLVLFGIQSSTWSECWTSDLALWKRSVEIDDKSAHAHNSVGAALFDLGHYEDAKLEFRKALDVMPWDALARHNYALVLFLLGDSDRAFRQWDAAEFFANEHLPDLLPRIYLYRGWAYQTLENYELAEKEYTCLLEDETMKPEDRARGYFARGELYESLGDVERARADLKEILSLVDPSLPIYTDTQIKLAMWCE